MCPQESQCEAVCTVGKRFEPLAALEEPQLQQMFAEALKLGDHVMIMRAGQIVQIGRPEELVARPADDYVKDFVRDIPKSHVLTLRWVMRDATPDDVLDGPVFTSDTVIRTAVHAVAASERPIRVIDDGKLVGVVDRAHVLEAIAGGDAA